jgi:hypothetical protein
MVHMGGCDPASRLDLRGACAKLVRALTHLQALGDEFESMARRASGNLTVAPEERQAHPQGSRHLFRLGSLIRPSDNVGPIVGDYIQNLRSALDHLAWEMVGKGDDPAPRRPTLVQFPIYSRAWSPNDVRRGAHTFRGRVDQNLPGVPEPQRRLVRRHQPFHAGQWQLGSLAELSNQDKHRILTPIHLFATDLRRRHFRPTAGRVVRWRRLLTEAQPVNEDTPFLDVIVDDPAARV